MYILVYSYREGKGIKTTPIGGNDSMAVDSLYKTLSPATTKVLPFNVFLKYA